MDYTMISREQMRKIYYEESGSNVRKYMIIAAIGLLVLVLLLFFTLGGTPGQTPDTSTTLVTGEPDIDQQSDTIKTKLTSVVNDLDAIIDSQS